MNAPMYRTIQKKDFPREEPFSMSRVYLNVKTLQKLVETNLSVLSKERLKQLREDILALDKSIDRDLVDHQVPDHVMDAYDDASSKVTAKLQEIDKWLLK